MSCTIYFVTTKSSPAALLNINETYANLHKRAKNSFDAQLITSIKKLGNDTIYNWTAEIVSVFTSYNSTLFAQQQQQQQQRQQWESSPTLDSTQKESSSRYNNLENQEGREIATDFESRFIPVKDGITYRFLDKAFSCIGPLLVDVFNNLFTATYLPHTKPVPVLFRLILKEGKDKEELTIYIPIDQM
ncbi:unnamed protein product [Ambrosiozyma monospora]|uniref:Unnamed protein product n=1 Tax=Ambrosiozyma monospora TaxID=43982 RepID=A0A9W6YWI7_AMBMO|nr:unnamed protein product [Ambrosiozyma monospora]